MAINLLPDAYKTEVRSEYRRRVIIGFGVLFAVIICVNAALLAPSWLAFASQERELQRQWDAIQKGSLFLKVSEIESSIRRLNRDIREYRAEDRAVNRVTPVFGAALESRRAGVAIDTLVFAVPKNGSRAGLTIAGHAAGRAALIAFSKALGERPVIESVESPISNLLHENDINYTMTATLR